MAGFTHGFDRWLYRGKRPNRMARVLNRAWATLAAAGVGPDRLVRLEVRGRHTGRTVSFPVVVADYQSERYLVSMLGEASHWVRNVRAAGGHAVITRARRARSVQLEEVEPGSRAPILRRYLECAPGARAHIPVDPTGPLEEFEQVARQVPVFRITEQESTRPGGR